MAALKGLVHAGTVQKYGPDDHGSLASGCDMNHTRRRAVSFRPTKKKHFSHTRRSKTTQVWIRMWGRQRQCRKDWRSFVPRPPHADFQWASDRANRCSPDVNLTPYPSVSCRLQTHLSYKVHCVTEHGLQEAHCILQATASTGKAHRHGSTIPARPQKVDRVSDRALPNPCPGFQSSTSTCKPHSHAPERSWFEGASHGMSLGI